MRSFTAKRLLSLMLSFALFLTMLPDLTLRAEAAVPVTSGKVVDRATVNTWQEIFTDDSTANAGGVWTDKSVFADVQSYLNSTSENDEEIYTPTAVGDNSFLVALSAIASNKSVKGYSTKPTDTVFVLDMSSSMEGSNYNYIDDLAIATNNAVKDLLALNKNNRVAVVLYSGAAGQNNGSTLPTRVLMPLDRYTTTDSGGNFIEYKTVDREEAVGVVSGVTNSKGQGRNQFSLPDEQTRWSSGTFTQDGIYVGANILLAASQYVEAGNVQAGKERQPIMVLMSDGAPSVFSTDFAGTMDGTSLNDRLESEYQNSTTSTGAATEFMVQLTAAWAKYQIEQKYQENDLLFYTLGLETNGEFSTGSLNPANPVPGDASDNGTGNGGNLTAQQFRNILQSYWDGYFADRNYSLRNNTTQFTITTGTDIREKLMKAVNSTEAENLRENGLNKYRYYVDKYYEAETITEFADAFNDIINEIILQSKYYPTFVEGGVSVNYGGYLTMVDTIGRGMEVKNIKNISVGGRPYYGRNAASTLASMPSNGTIADDLLEAVKIRLGVNEATALAVIQASQAQGVLYYNNENDFRNVIGWYGDYKHGYVDPVYKGTLSSTAVPADANCVIYSYYYYGQGLDPNTRVGDMRYIEVEVVNFFDDSDVFPGQTKVRVKIPASLIPLVEYNVELNGENINSPVTSLTKTGADAPIRLLYEVGLKDDINSLNVGTNNTFYSNKWDYAGGNINIGVTPPRDVGNSYAYFEPSSENEYMYYQQDTAIYVQENGEYKLYTGAKPAKGDGRTYYSSRYVYTKPANGGETIPHLEYIKIGAEDIGEAVQKETGDTWYLPKGTHIMANGTNKINYKSGNTAGGLTETYKTYSTYYISDTINGTTNEYNMQVALGNNGKLTLTQLQGIRLQKIVPVNSGITGVSEYTFTITGEGIVNGEEYSVYVADNINENNTNDVGRPTKFTAANNSLTVKLPANRTMYITGLAAGRYTITEPYNSKYVASVITPADNATENSTTVTVAANTFAQAAFTNIARTTGDLTISKEITHPFGTDYTIPTNIKFEFEGTLLFNGAALTGTYTAQKTNDSTVTSITPDSNGKFTVTLGHDEQLEIFNLPQGTVATVEEKAVIYNPGTADEQKKVIAGSGFTAAYWENGVLDGSAIDGQVTVTPDRTVSVIVVNGYTPTTVNNPIISLVVNKALTGRDWAANDRFDFELQEWNGTTWVKIGERKTIKGSDNAKTLNFTDEIRSENYSRAGIYYYRVAEIEPTPHGILGVDYDKALHGFVVEVADEDMDGSLEVRTVRKASTTDAGKITVTPNTTTAGGFDVTANFVNTFDADATEAAIEIHKVVENPSNSHLATLNGFTFTVTEVNADKTPKTGAVSSTSQPTSTTGTTRVAIPYTTANLINGTTTVYHYAIQEVNDGKTGWIYASEPEYVTVRLTLEGADESTGTAAKIVATAYNGIVTDFTGLTGSTTATVSFKNTYVPTGATFTIPAVSKTLAGKDMTAGEFTFSVTGANGTEVYINNEGAAQKVSSITGTNAADGTVTFDNRLYFTKTGTYYYDISEVKGSNNGIKYDEDVYRMVVTVTDNAGTLTAAYQVLNTANNNVVFENTYTPHPVEYRIKGTKELTGRNLREGEFTFVLEEVTNATGETKTGRKWTTKNTDSGSFVFPEITYEKAGSYYYVITEQTHNEANNGIKYDVNNTNGTVVTVIVEDNGQGVMSARQDISQEELKFTNNYAPEGFITFDVHKNLRANRAITAGEFSFSITSVNGTILYIKENDAAKEVTSISGTNKADGKVEFEKQIYVTAPGTYYFVVKENTPNKNNKIIYDDTQFDIEVTVEDNGEGALVTTATKITVGGQPWTAQNIEFVNYDTSGDESVRITGTKVLEGRPLNDGEFTFLMKETDSSFTPNGETLTAVNTGDTFSFDLIFDEIGTYYYVVTEDSSVKADNVKYDDTTYYVTVTVEADTEDEKGGLKATVKIETKALLILRETVENIVFKNIYTVPTPTPTPTPPPPPGTPDTGDDFNVGMYAGIMGLSAVALTVLRVVFFKNKKKEQAANQPTE